MWPQGDVLRRKQLFVVTRKTEHKVVSDKQISTVIIQCNSSTSCHTAAWRTFGQICIHNKMTHGTSTTLYFWILRPTKELQWGPLDWRHKRLKKVPSMCHAGYWKNDLSPVLSDQVSHNKLTALCHNNTNTKQAEFRLMHVPSVSHFVKGKAIPLQA
jgi:hypothetical protein